MTEFRRCQAALRIFGDGLLPEELSRLLGHSYTAGWVKGYQYSTSSGAVIVKKTGAWILEAESVGGDDLDSQISQILDSIDMSPKDWNLISERFDIDMFCGWFMRESSEGIAVSAQTMRLLSELNIALFVDIYASSDND